jgi:hypothetical protein
VLSVINRASVGTCTEEDMIITDGEYLLADVGQSQCATTHNEHYDTSVESRDVSTLAFEEQSRHDGNANGTSSIMRRRVNRRINEVCK